MNPRYRLSIVKTENPVLGLFVNRTLRVIGHEFIKGLNGDVLLVTHEDKSMSYVSVAGCRIKISKELFIWKAEIAEQQSQGNAKAEDLKKV